MFSYLWENRKLATLVLDVSHFDLQVRTMLGGVRYKENHRVKARRQAAALSKFSDGELMTAYEPGRLSLCQDPRHLKRRAVSHDYLPATPQSASTYDSRQLDTYRVMAV